MVPASGSEREYGLPLVTTFAASDYGGLPQVWNAAQTADGLLYFRDLRHIVEFDGTRWQTVIVPGGTRSMAITPDAIFVGLEDGVGRLTSKAGRLTFDNLLAEIADFRVHEVTGALATEQGVFFTAEGQVLLWADGQMQSWQGLGGGSSSGRSGGRSGGRFSGLWSASNGDVLLHEQGVGLLRWQPEGLALMPGGEQLAEFEIIDVLDDGSTMLLASASKGLWRWDVGAMRPAVGPGLQQRLQRAQISAIEALPTGGLAIATQTEGVSILGASGELEYQLTIDSGLPSNAIYSLLVDREGALWVTTEAGIARLEVSSPTTAFRADAGLDGGVWTAVRYRGHLYVGTYRGVARLERAGDGSAGMFTQIPGIETDCRQLQVVGDRLLAATDDGLAEIHNDAVEWLIEVPVSALQVFSEQPTELLVGLPDGIGRLRRTPAGWVYDGPIEATLGIGRVRRLVTVSPTEFWATVPSRSVVRIQFSDTAERAVTVTPYSTSGQLERVNIFGGVLRLTGPQGISRFDPLAKDPLGRPFVRDSAMEQAVGLAGGIRVSAECETGEIWMATTDGVVVLDRQADGYVRQPQTARMPGTYVTNFYSDPQDSNIMWITTRSGLYRFDRALDLPGASFSALIRRLDSLGSDDIALQDEEWRSSLDGELDLTLPFSNKSLRFTVAAPSMAEPSANRFQFLLEGFDDDWSSWTEQGSRDYTNLSEGRYRFRVRARNSRRVISEEAALALRIQAPWFRSWWAYGCYVIIATALLSAWDAWRSGRLKRERSRLEAVVASRTRELRLEKERVEQQAEELELRRQQEAEVQQAQKLESLGVMAGGIAHDFNNLLVGVLGYADLLEPRLRQDPSAHGHLQGIVQSAEQAADLCRQMLAYSGQGQLQRVPIDLGELIENMGRLLRVSLSKKAELRFRLQPNLPGIEGDTSQVRQVIMNLLINASEALDGQAGVITLESRSLELHSGDELHNDLGDRLAPGPYVEVKVTDTGSGMDEETRGKIFEPFFTTKFLGRGLGLSAVGGILRSHQGGIGVTSEPGQGTAISLFFPVTASATKTSKASADRLGNSPGGRVLLVDDEVTVRTVATRMLERGGFEVEAVEDGPAAIEAFRRQPELIDCVVLDLTMPQMDGLEVLAELRALRPSIPVVLASGYSKPEAATDAEAVASAVFLQKPFTMRRLLDAVSQALEDSRNQP